MSTLIVYLDDMQLTEYKISQELSQFTESFWMFNSPICNSFPLIPDGTFNVIVAIAPFKIDRQLYKEGIYLIPLLKTTKTITASDKLYGIRLKAFAYVNVLLSNGLKELGENRVAPLTTVSNYFDTVLRRFKAASQIEDVTEELKTLNYEILRKKFRVNDVLRHKVNYILFQQGNINVQDMSENFGVSRQALHKSFKKNIGIGPKELSNVWRANNYLRLISQKDSLTHCAIDAGFYDQAHSINTFKMHWNMSPGAFLKEAGEIGNYISETIHKRFTHHYDPDL